MAIDDTTEVTVQELRTIVQGLKMSGLAFVEEGALDEIRSMIKSLPSAEEINRMTTTPDAIKRLKMDIGNIMRFIELYGKRDKEFKTRYKARTGLPPRYKVLEWRDNMKQNAREFVRELIKVSAYVDDQGRGQIAGNLIKCAQKVREDKIAEEDVAKVVSDLKEAGFDKESELIREAQLQWMKDMWKGVKDVGKQVGRDIADPIREKVQQYKDVFQFSKYRSSLDGINQTIEKTLGNVTQAISGIKNPDDKAALQDMAQKLNYMLSIGRDTVRVVEEEEAENAASPAVSETVPEAVPEIPFEVGQAVTYRGNPAEVVKVFPESNTVQIKGSGGRVFGVKLEELISENPAGAVPQVKTPAPTPAMAPVGASSKKFNLKKASK